MRSHILNSKWHSMLYAYLQSYDKIVNISTDQAIECEMAMQLHYIILSLIMVDVFLDGCSNRIMKLTLYSSFVEKPRYLARLHN